MPPINGALSRSWPGGVYFTLDLKAAGDEAGSKWPAHCVEGTTGQALASGLVIPSGALLVTKRRSMSGFGDAHRDEETILEALLRERGVTRVVLFGLAFEYCVRATALDAVARGFSVAVVLSGTRAYSESSGRAIETRGVLEKAGVKVYDSFEECFNAV